MDDNKNEKLHFEKLYELIKDKVVEYNKINGKYPTKVFLTNIEYDMIMSSTTKELSNRLVSSTVSGDITKELTYIDIKGYCKLDIVYYSDKFKVDI